MDIEEYMCPFCVTPWKCNGPHIDIDELEEFEHYVKWKVDQAVERVRQLSYELRAMNGQFSGAMVSEWIWKALEGEK